MWCEHHGGVHGLHHYLSFDRGSGPGLDSDYGPAVASGCCSDPGSGPGPRFGPGTGSSLTLHTSPLLISRH